MVCCAAHRRPPNTDIVDKEASRSGGIRAGFGLLQGLGLGGSALERGKETGGKGRHSKCTEPFPGVCCFKTFSDVCCGEQIALRTNRQPCSGELRAPAFAHIPRYLLREELG